jgi:hypothetical protein
MLCRVLAVSRAGFYASQRREISARRMADAELGAQVVAIHGKSRGTYGAVRCAAGAGRAPLPRPALWPEADRPLDAARRSRELPAAVPGMTIPARGVAPAPDLVERRPWSSGTDGPPRGWCITPIRARRTLPLAFGRRCRETGIAMGSVANCFDNAVYGSFFATLKTELQYRRS